CRCWRIFARRTNCPTRKSRGCGGFSIGRGKDEMRGKILLGWLAPGLVLAAGGESQKKPPAEMVEIEVRFFQATKAQAEDILIPSLSFPVSAEHPAEILAV